MRMAKHEEFRFLAAHASLTKIPRSIIPTIPRQALIVNLRPHLD